MQILILMSSIRLTSPCCLSQCIRYTLGELAVHTSRPVSRQIPDEAYERTFERIRIERAIGNGCHCLLQRIAVAFGPLRDEEVSQFFSPLDFEAGQLPVVVRIGS